MTTFITIGDPHFKTTNIQDVDLFIEKLINLINDKKPDFIICLGDVLDTHERLNTIPLNKAYDLIDKLRNITTTYVIVGNHDMISNQQFLTQNHWMNGLKEWNNVIIVDKITYIHYNEQFFVLVPYVYPGRFLEALQTGNEDWKNANCIFAHQEFSGCKMGSIISIDGDKWSLDSPTVISGHIHSRQTPQKNIYYPGSAMQHAFGESIKNIIAFFTFNNNDHYILEEIDLELPRKNILYMDVDNADEYKIDEDSKDKIKISISGIYEEFKAFKKTEKYKNLIEKGVKVVFKPKKIEIKAQKEYKHIVADETNFSNILNKIIINTKDSYLVQAYEIVVNNKQINEEIMFLG
jgi:DNA repair exonuclease SbcCD nuclease subunit